MRLVVNGYGMLFIGYALLCCISFNSFAQEKLYVASQATTSLNRIYLPLYEEFEKRTGIQVVRVRVDDIKEFDSEETWLLDNGDPIDVINGQVTSRLIGYYKAGKVKSLNTLWKNYKLEKDFAHIEDVLVYDGEILALPHSIYTWQIYYSKAVFSAEKLSVPTTFDELVNICIHLANKDIAPFHVMDKTAWSQMAWFEYLILRTYGLDFYNSLTEGKVAYTSEKVKTVMQYWQRLIQANCFSTKFGPLNWQSATPYMLRGLIAMIFNGPGVSGKLEFIGHKNDVDFFTFPKINDIPRYETAPINAFIASSLSNKTTAIEKFLHFMSLPRVQETLTHPFAVLPANSRSKHSLTDYSKQATHSILTASGTSTFFDRKVPPAFELASRNYFIDVVKTGDIQHFMNNMERLRIMYYQKEKS